MSASDQKERGMHRTDDPNDLFELPPAHRPDEHGQPAPPLPTRRERGATEHLEALRAEVRMCAPLVAVSLIRPPRPGEPTLRLAYRHQGGQIRYDTDDGVYRWTGTGQQLGHPDRAAEAATAAAGTLGAPIRNMRLS